MQLPSPIDKASDFDTEEVICADFLLVIYMKSIFDHLKIKFQKCTQHKTFLIMNIVVNYRKILLLHIRISMDKWNVSLYNMLNETNTSFHYHKKRY